MFENVTPEKATAFIRMSIALVCGWPLPSMATNAQIICYNVLRVLSTISVIGLLIPVSNAAIIHFDDAITFTKASIMLVGCVHVLSQLLIFTIQHDRYQVLIEDIIASLKKAKSYERNVYQRYVDTYCRFYGLTVMWYFISPAVVVIGSFVLHEKFPTVSEYPFSIDSELVRIIFVMHQSFVGLQCSAAVSANIFPAFLILNAAARYEILMIDLRKCTSVDDLTMCVKKYYSITRFAKDCADASQYIAWFTILYGSTDLVLCGLTIIGQQPLMVKLQFIFLTVITLLEVLMCALPADALINMSTNAVQSAYESTWYSQVLGMQKTVLRILVPQAPIVMSLKCFVPRLSLEYYCSYISNSVTLFTALRMVLGDDADLESFKSTNSSCCSD